MSTPIYDPTKTYEENYSNGPFGVFTNPSKYEEQGEPKHSFLGFPVYTPFGIPAGPLLNSKYVESAFKMGYDIPVYKTVRSDIYPCHPFPNVLAVHVDGALTPDKSAQPLVADTNYDTPVSITNSFGVPSRKAEVWQDDARRAVAAAGKGQVMVMSFMGTVRENQTPEEFVADYAKAGELAAATRAKVLEVNLSCPNIGNEGLVCYNLDMTERVCKAIREVIGDIPLILKVGYYGEDEPVERLIEVTAKYAQAIAAINTIQATIIDDHGNQALPGPMRAKSGVCGHTIKWAGLEMTDRLARLREKAGAKFSIIGVGGVTTPADYQEYIDAGADVVMSATGAMWDPELAIKIKQAG